VIREVQRKLNTHAQSNEAGGTRCGDPPHPKALSDLKMWLERAERIRTQQRHDRNKLYALHAPESRVHRQGQGAQALRIRCQGQFSPVKGTHYDVPTSVLDEVPIHDSVWPVRRISSPRDESFRWLARKNATPGNIASMNFPGSPAHGSCSRRCSIPSGCSSMGPSLRLRSR
jgi:hypothetical protein